ncbi:MAG: type II methionyl aminopeptidase [Nanoarchaeota archaeon]
MDFDNVRKAGKITAEAVAFARSHITRGMELVDIAEKIEDFIRRKGAEPAFPVNLSINEIAAHATPGFNDTDIARGLLKVDIGVQVNGWTGDTAFSLDLDDRDENKKLIEAAEAGLDAALGEIKLGISTQMIGTVIEKEIKRRDAVPIHNLTGHSIEQWNVHAGISIPNHSTGASHILKEGVYAVEPFTTFGAGKVRDGKPSGIYHFAEIKGVRDNFSREVLAFIVDNYKEMPFCSRWIHKKFGTRGLLALRLLEQASVLYQYPQLIEASGAKVAQAEHTIIITKGKIEVITR